jgi:hypothetical protein
MRTILLAISAAVLLPAAAQAQNEDLDRSNVFGAGPSYRRWKLESSFEGEDAAEETISQFHLPFSQAIPLGRSATLLAYGAYASTTLELDDGDETTLSGITDVRVKGIYRLMDRAQVSLGVNLPIGKQTLEQSDEEGGARELEVAQAMWSPILGFRTKRMGAGFDIELGAGYATPLSPTSTLGISAAYVAKGEYDLFETEDGVTTFRPGSEISGTIGLDFRPSEGTLLRFDLTGRSYGDDESNDLKVFKPGTQLELDATFARITNTWNFALRGRNVSRTDDELIADSGDDVVRTTVSAPNSLWGLGQAYYQIRPTVAIGGEAELGAFGESETVLADGTTFGIGPGVRIGAAGARRITIRALYLTGNALDENVDLSGFDISLAAAFPF